MKKSVATFLRGIVSVTIVLVFVIAVSGCQKEEGTMEKIGKKADEGVQATKKATEKVGEKVGKKADEGVDATKDVMKKAGEKIGEGAEKVEKVVKKAVEKVEEKVKK